MKDSDSHNPKAWWQRTAPSFETIMVMLTLIAFLVLVSLILLERWAHADTLPECASIKAVTVDPRVIMHQPDGDTFHVFNFDVPNVVKIRVKDAETPEHGDEGFEEAKEFTRAWLNRGPFRIITCGKPTLDRIVGIVMRDGKTLADELKAAGFLREKH